LKLLMFEFESGCFLTLGEAFRSRVLNLLSKLTIEIMNLRGQS
jgi:hypothetical protein